MTLLVKPLKLKGIEGLEEENVEVRDESNGEEEEDAIVVER